MMAVHHARFVYLTMHEHLVYCIAVLVGVGTIAFHLHCVINVSCIIPGILYCIGRMYDSIPSTHYSPFHLL